MAEKAKRNGNVVANFSMWFAKLVDVEIDFEGRDFRRILGQSSALKREGYDLTVAQQVITAMVNKGISVRSPQVVKWQSPDRERTWYEYASPPLPPLHDGFGMILANNGKIHGRF